jgi:hypothetical protein
MFSFVPSHTEENSGDPLQKSRVTIVNRLK